MVIFQDKKVSAVASQGLLLDQDLRFFPSSSSLSLEMVIHSERLQVMYFSFQRLKFKLQGTRRQLHKTE